MKMAGILSRFKDIMSSNINALLDKVEDPMKMIDQYLRNLESDLGKVKAETTAVMAEETKSKRELDECMDSINKMQTYAEKALLSGNEADARTFLSKKGELNNKLISLQQTYNIAKENSTKMREMHDKLIKDISQLNTRRDELKAKMAVANTQEKLNKIGSSVNGAIGNMSKFDEMEAKINKKLDTANAMAELNNSQKEENIEDLIAKYDNETKNTSSEIDDELSELKSKLGLDK
jgi:phage shock protein A